MAPCHVLLGLQARRRKPRIIRYNHEHPGPAHDGRAQRRCPRICEHSYPSIYYEFVANFSNVRNPPSGGQIAELTMEAGAAGRIVNSDETHHKPSNEGERGGSRANTQTDPDLPRTGRRKVANERHITGEAREKRPRVDRAGCLRYSRCAPRRGSCSGAGHRALSCRPPSPPLRRPPLPFPKLQW